MSDPRQLRILIVEDEGIIAMDIEGIIEDEGHIVAGWATAATEAVEMYDRVKPDLVLLDVQLLGGSSGIDVARALRDRGGASIIFLTANAAKVEADFHGAIGVLSKPFSHSRMVATLSYLQEGVFDPPPASDVPNGLRLAPDYASAWC